MSDKTLKYLIAAGGILLAVLLIVILVLALTPSEEERAIEKGIAYLESLEAKTPALTEPTDPTQSSVSEPISTDPGTSDPTEPTEPSDPNGLSAEQRKLIEQIRNEEVDIWSMFHDYVILGDSRAVGFWYFDFLPEENCLTGGGDTIRNVEMNMDGILALDPKYIFLCYGLNDVSIGYWDNPEEYVAEMMQVIADLNERLPEATVIVSSILPARDPAFELSSKWYNIPDFSAAVGEACREAGVIFVDNDAICEQYADWWQPDGIHVRPEFYPYWAQNLIMGIIEGGAYE